MALRVHEIVSHCQALARVVHPQPQGQSFYDYWQKVLRHYDIDVQPLTDDDLTMEQAIVLWFALLRTENERLYKISEQYGKQPSQKEYQDAEV